MKEEKNYELVVIGGGLAGVSGAIAAKRLGLSVAIIQDRPVFGGNASSEIRVNIGGARAYNPWARETGIINEIFLEERRRNFQPHINSYTNSNLDLVLYDVLRSEEVDMFLNTSARKAIMKSSDLIEGVYCTQFSSEKEFIIKGNYFLDASGDGAIACSAGAKFKIGREGRGEFGESLAPEESDMGIMGNSLLFLIRDVGKPVKFEPPDWIVKYPKDSITLRLRNHSYLPGYWWIEIGYPFDTINENERIKHKLIAHLLGVWDHLKNEGDHKFKNFSLEWVGMVPGKRESRRFMGDYILKEQDIKMRRFFPDAVAYGGWWIDLHTPGGILAKDAPPTENWKSAKERDESRAYVYPIPYRCLYSRNIKNLLLAGRNISVTHVALGSTRVMGTCAILGQAAGTSVYFCKKYKIYPGDLYPSHIKEVQQQLLKDGCFIPGIKNEDKKDFFKDSKIKASSHTPLRIPKSSREVNLDIPRGQKLPLKGRVEKIILPIRAVRDTHLKFHLRSSFDLWDFTEERDLIFQKVDVSSGEQNVEIKLSTDFKKGIYWFFLDKNDKLYLKIAEVSIPGLCSIFMPRRRWFFSLGEQIYFEISPALYPFGPENIASGVSRPEKWTNVWISDGKKGFPQWVEFEMEEEKEINFIQITFEGGLDRRYAELPPFFIPPEIPSHYKIYYWNGSKWKEIFEKENNSKYFVRHSFPPVRASKVKIEILSVNGANFTSIYEARAYNIEGGSFDEKD